jgi:LysM repeat protein
MARRWVLYLVLNVLVSAATMLIVLMIWDQSHQPQAVTVPTLDATEAHAASTWAPTEQPSPTPYMYVVRPGDTLSSISQDFGVDMDELAAVNGIIDVDVLDPGMRLVIPPSARVVVAASRYPTVTPQAGEDFPWPVLDEVQGAGDPELEMMFVYNSGPTADLTGWKVRTNGGAEYAFGSIVLVTRGGLWLHTDAGVDSSIDLYWGSSEPLWVSGEEAFLVDAQGNLRSVFLIP